MKSKSPSPSPRWISSAGGPLVLLPKVLLPRWWGTRGVPSDYELACGVEGYVGVIEKAGGEMLVLGDEPLQTAVSSLNGRPCLVRWVYAPSPGVAESAVATMVPAQPGDTLELELDPGAYRVHVYEFAPAQDMKFLVHEFEPHTGW